jgi:hypothetical protein
MLSQIIINFTYSLENFLELSNISFNYKNCNYVYLNKVQVIGFKQLFDKPHLIFNNYVGGSIFHDTNMRLRLNH